MRFTPGTSVRHSWLAWMVLLWVGAGAAPAATPDAESAGSRARPIAVQIKQLHTLRVTTAGRVIENSVRRIQSGCPQEVSSHTDADFAGGAFIVQAGFAEGEIAAASYVLSPSDFPLRIDLMEMIFATSGAIMSTTTHWSIMVWEGTPDNGNLVVQFSSDGEILPHIELPPGTNGVNVAVSVDPGDPDQIIVTDNGSHTFSFGYRIDQHNAQTQDPCFIPPPTCCNAFPTTDLSGLQSQTGNWLNGINCGLLGCPTNGGWATFLQLPSLCTPSGDWVMRASWTPLECDGGDTGACCSPEGNCLDLTPIDCAVLDGAFEGEGTICAGIECPQPTEACCFEGAGCVDLEPANCEPAGGFPQGPGTLCDDTECFATGACCMPNGSCVDDTEQSACQAGDGVYQGHNTLCDDADCPAPSGACCFDTGFCFELTADQCAAAGAPWAGPLTDCTDADGNDIADACENDCPSDIDGNGEVGPFDLALVLGFWGPCDGCDTDLDGDGIVGPMDLALVLGFWGPCE
ncbi:MAG: hypothetical protein IID34_10820 [Planctomycetes bacterium]|nr:hypothetical protein [Planctomycetota bacterium]